jgi:phosphate acetyltransferase
MSMEPRAGKAAVALGVMELLARQVGSIAVFRPVISDADGRDALIDLLHTRYDLDQPYASTWAATYDDAAALVDGGDLTRLVEQVAARYGELKAEHDFVLCLGTDYTGPSAATELELNATLAANLGTPVLTVLSGQGKSAGAIARTTSSTRHLLVEHGCALVATVVNRVDPALRAQVADGLDAGDIDAPIYVMADLPVLSALTVDEVGAALHAKTLTSSATGTSREIEGYLVGSGHLETVLSLLRDGTLLLASGDRSDLAVAVAAVAGNPELPTPAGLVLTCGLEPGAHVRALLDASGVPVLAVAQDTYAAMHALDAARGEIRATSTRKIAAALGEFAAAVDAEELTPRIRLARTDVVTPLMFSAGLLERARSERRHIVLPEGEDERVLRAAEELVHRGVVDLTLLGPPAAVAAKVDQLGLDLDGAKVVDPVASPMRRTFAHEYAALRAHKGVTFDAAYDLMADPSYFGTMLVHAGLVDGMVSGAAHTTAATVRPALEIIRTAPGVRLVSSAFLMCLPDRVLVFADCAVNPDPTTEQLADIAISSADTAAAFGIEPLVAMLSYSTGSSGEGAEVDKVRDATALVASRRPDLPLAGPIQYDAAVDPDVGAAKLPGSPVAGHATVLVFPDLGAGNATYKAVQRAADAVAIGPVLQGLRKPVNDLSRGCTVPDIVNTVAITAIQAQQVRS